MIQLLENTGDVWHDYENAREKVINCLGHEGGTNSLSPHLK